MPLFMKIILRSINRKQASKLILKIGLKNYLKNTDGFESLLKKEFNKIDLRQFFRTTSPSYYLFSCQVDN